ncbi:MAG: hypothetical protein SWX82_06065 [Cyanobacteriota bacterium]|nr:hypothetical protein [Cyanobacteriota bacterium]
MTKSEEKNFDKNSAVNLLLPPTNIMKRVFDFLNLPNYQIPDHQKFKIQRRVLSTYQEITSPKTDQYLIFSICQTIKFPTARNLTEGLIHLSRNYCLQNLEIFFELKFT